LCGFLRVRLWTLLVICWTVQTFRISNLAGIFRGFYWDYLTSRESRRFLVPRTQKSPR
jgi:hypothetical protein